MQTATQNTDTILPLIRSFYNALTTHDAQDVRSLIEACTHDTWRSHAGEGISKSREEFIQQVIGFGKILPDLAWNIQEIIINTDHNKVVVRSEAKATPAGAFMGVPHSGKSFRIMTIDIHTIVDGKLQTAHHVEDWAGAFRQLQA